MSHHGRDEMSLDASPRPSGVGDKTAQVHHSLGGTSPFASAHGLLLETKAQTSQTRAVAVRDLANQLSLGCITPTTSLARRRNLIVCAATPQSAPLVPLFEMTMNESSERPRPDSGGFHTCIGLQHFHSRISPARWCGNELYRKSLISLNE
jgi:hypothetical protein